MMSVISGHALLMMSAWILPRNSQVQLITDCHLSLKTKVDSPATYASPNDRSESKVPNE